MRWLCALVFVGLPGLAGAVLWISLVATPLSSSLKAEDAVALPPEFQEAIGKGMEAAKSQKWGVAIEYFTMARKIAPTAPQALFNLALAHDKVGGHELLAFAWYHAYLCAAPVADNTAAVRQRLAQLEKKVRETTNDLVKSARKASEKLPPEAGAQYGYTEIAAVLAENGDDGGAIETAEAIRAADEKQYNNKTIADQALERAWLAIAEAQARRGDFQMAMDTAEKIKRVGSRAICESKIAVTMTKRGNESGALDCARKMPADQVSARDDVCYALLVGKSAEFYRLKSSGQIAEARVLLAKAVEHVPIDSRTWARANWYISLAGQYLELDSNDAALQMIGRAETEVEALAKGDKNAFGARKGELLNYRKELITLQIGAGSTDEAARGYRRTLGKALEESKDEFGKSPGSYLDLARNYINAVQKNAAPLTDDLDLAKKLVSRLLSDARTRMKAKDKSHPGPSMSYVSNTGSMALDAGDIDAALESLGLLDELGRNSTDKYYRDGFRAKCAIEQARRGRSSKAVQMVLEIPDPVYKSMAMQGMAEVHVKAGEFDKAAALAEEMDQPAMLRGKVMVWISIALARFKAGQEDKANEAVGKAFVLVSAAKTDDERGALWRTAVDMLGNSALPLARGMTAMIKETRTREQCEKSIAYAELKAAGGSALAVEQKRRSRESKRAGMVSNWKFQAEMVAEKPWGTNLAAYLDSLRSQKTQEIVRAMISTAKEILYQLNSMLNAERENQLDEAALRASS